MVPFHGLGWPPGPIQGAPQPQAQIRILLESADSLFTDGNRLARLADDEVGHEPGEGVVPVLRPLGRQTVEELEAVTRSPLEDVHQCQDGARSGERRV